MTDNLSSPVFDYDIIIVGGGPAGVSCAITVAQQGFSVAIVDKKPRNNIGDKTCGDAIDLAALERIKEEIGLAYPSGDEVSDEIKKMSIAASDINTKISLIAPGFVVDRLKYGQRLLKEAETLCVAIISDTAVRQIIIEKINGKKFLQGIKINKNSEMQELRAKFTIDASGAYAVIRKQLPEEFLNTGITKELSENELWPTYREIIQLKDNITAHQFRNEIVLLYKNDFAPPGYFWIFTKGDGKLNCGIGWMKYQSVELGKLKEAYLKELEHYYQQESYHVLKKGGGQIPVRPPFDSLVFNGGALAGDAACMVHPVTAEGHAPALNTAIHLGKAIVKALKSNRRDADSLWEYNVKVAVHYGKKHTQALIMRNFLEDVGADNLAYLIRRQIFRNEELDLIFSGDEISLSLMDKITRAIKLLVKPKLLLWLKRIFSGMEKVEDIYSAYPNDPKDFELWRNNRNKQLKLNY